MRAKASPRRRTRLQIEAFEPRLVPSTVELISRADPSLSPPFASGNGFSSNDLNHSTNRISADGRYVVFTSAAKNLVPGDTNNNNDIFRYDRVTNTMLRVSVSNTGVQGNQESSNPTISPDGNFVTFGSWSTNLVTGDTNARYDIFVRDISKGTTSRVSVATNGAQSNVAARRPSLSADGQIVVFDSNSTNLVTGDTNNWDDVFVHNRSTGTTNRISVASDGTQGNSVSASASIDASGRYVVFSSQASNLVPNDTNNFSDVFIHDLSNGTTALVSRDSNGASSANGSSSGASISSDGRFVVYKSAATNLGPGGGQPSNFDIFVYDRQTGVTTLESIGPDGQPMNDVGNVVSLSADGRYVAFSAKETSISTFDQIYVRDRISGTTTRVNLPPNGQTANERSLAPSISGDGKVLMFVSEASNYISNDGNGATDVFAVALTGGPPVNTAPTISNVANQSSTGAAVGPVNLTIGDAETNVNTLTVTRASSNTTLLPLNNIVLGGTGANRTVTLTPVTGLTGFSTITLTVTDEGGLTATDTFVMTVTNPNDPPTTLVGTPEFGVGSGSTTTTYNPDGTVRFTLTPFPGFTGPLRTASGHFNNDNVADLVVGTGPGGATHVKIFDGVTKAELFTIDPFEASFTGGIYVAAGDITGDGKADLVITPDEGGGPRARVFSGNGFTQIADFFGIDDPNFRGGARASVGDLNGDGKGDLLVAAGFGGGPRVAAYDGAQLGSNGGPKLFGDFFAFEQSLRNGTFIAAGDVNGDGFADMVAGGGPGGGPRVYILDGLSLSTSGTITPIGNFFAGDVNSRGGIRVTVKDLDGDAKADLVVGAGTGAGNRVTAYRGSQISVAGGTPPELFALDAGSGSLDGVYVG